MCAETIADGMVVRQTAGVDYQISKCAGPTAPAFGVALGGGIGTVYSRVVHLGHAMVLSGAVYAEGDRLTCDSASKVVKASGSGDNLIGYALEAATAADQLKEAFICPAGGMASGSVVTPHKLTDQATKSTAYTLAATDSGTRIPCTGTWTLTVPVAATLGNGFSAEIICLSGAVTVDGPGSTNLALAPAESAYLFVSGGTLYGAKGAYTAL
jgi:hypothetical protein